METNVQNDGDIQYELVIGLVSAVGTENQLIIDLLNERLGRAGYQVQVVKVSSDVIPLLVKVDPQIADKYERITALMDAGNAARSIPDATDSVLADGIASVIYSRRKQDEKGVGLPLEKTAFIVDSLKRPEEVAQLRRIYPSGFILLGVHADESRRIKHMVQDQGIPEEKAKSLVERDREESNVVHGQRVNDTFHLADFFVRVSDGRDQVRGDIKRMVELIFGNPFVTPTFEEHAMFLAFSAALRSADLSRQVGAVVTRDSQILSTGANDCPKAGGGLYWPMRNPVNGCIEDHPLGRDFTREEGDSNRHQQRRLIDEILAKSNKQLLEALRTAAIDTDFAGVLNEKIQRSLRVVLERSGIRDLTEYGRVVHAEMEALLSCARTGQSTVGTTLYCTTFPCHNCAKHIVAAGVERVVYVEPYPKSKAYEFHTDSIEAYGEASCEKSGKVKFEAFVGIGPSRFFELFSVNLGSSYKLDRKDKYTGLRKEWSIMESPPRLQMRPISYLELEHLACKVFSRFSPPNSNGFDHV